MGGWSLGACGGVRPNKAPGVSGAEAPGVSGERPARLPRLYLLKDGQRDE